MATDKLIAMKIFRRVAELKSFTLAADDLDITPATASKHIAFLERALDTRLIHRTTRRLHLSDAGLAFLKRTQALLDDLEEAELEARDFQTHPKGTIRLNVPMSFGLTHLTKAIDSFLRRYPDIDIDLQFSDRLVDLVEKGVDIAIRIRHSLADSSLQVRALKQSRNVVCAAPAYLAHAPLIRSPADLVHHNCLLYTLHDRPKVWALGNQEVIVGGNFRTDSSLAIRQILMAGAGVGFLPRFLVEKDFENDLLTPLLADYPAKPYTVFALFPPGRKQPAKVRLLVAHIEEHLNQKSFWE
ncbi:LysR family transcriptional regulator [Saccharophagus degradans]|uniref:LysR family transcriptional regulator n=1 Tax=Saccharophagus degradans TaxID=86304 RepID=A0AAW7X6F1_9GAMM|nr:LysR family transcriptional regulator [Saccharophagus degradans]MDO6422452.1 LysR family transcriptional regulator [Saccharophagus degradans]MDO6606933.1 LysR family transcriptional regulator [Saccharophagus degradans]WGO99759.1 LysR family transcriptional regulator [Saccharophagus degradans]